MAKNRETGTTIDLLRHEYAEDGVCLVCVDHDRTVDFHSITTARLFKSRPSDWCQECAEIVYGNA